MDLALGNSVEVAHVILLGVKDDCSKVSWFALGVWFSDQWEHRFLKEFYENCLATPYGPREKNAGRATGQPNDTKTKRSRSFWQNLLCSRYGFTPGDSPPSPV